MSDYNKYLGCETPYGFKWGPVEVTRMMSDKRYGVCLGIKTRTKTGAVIERQLWISPTGRSVRMGAPRKYRNQA